jgi:hypothetical protein
MKVLSCLILPAVIFALPRRNAITPGTARPPPAAAPLGLGSISNMAREDQVGAKSAYVGLPPFPRRYQSDDGEYYDDGSSYDNYYDAYYGDYDYAQ